VIIQIIIPGRIQPKERPRFDSRHGRVYTPKATRNSNNLIAWHARKVRPAEPFIGPVDVRIVFVLPKTKKNRSVYATSRTDLDNLVKTVCDALNRIIWKDDAQVVSLSAYKTRGDDPRTEITVKPWTIGGGQCLTHPQPIALCAPRCPDISHSTTIG
jgi:Holliday junction resolvase RusA-like endonuclease